MNDGILFFRTRMGRDYYDKTLPRLVSEIARLNDVLERLADRLPATDASEVEPPSGPGTPADPDYQES